MATRDYFLQDYIHHSGIPLDLAGQPNLALNAKGRLTRAINEMLGICKGVLADGELVDTEIEFLNQWFQANRDIVDNFPAKEIYLRVQRVYRDGVVTAEERDDLKEVLARAAGTVSCTALSETHKAQARPLANSSTTLPFDDPEPEVTVPGSSFCFTGKFVSGTRDWCVEQVTKRGARFDPKPNPSTTFLVIGALGSRDWAHTSFGRKIEAAMQYKPPMKIVSEQHWLKYLS